MPGASLTFRVEGLEQVIGEIVRRKMNVRRTTRQILAPGADIIRDEIKQRGTGRFRTQVTRTIRVNMGALQAYALIGPVRKHAHIARFLEFGTRPHIIRARPGKMLHFGGRTVKSVSHPGARAKPFLRPAVNASRDRAVAAIAAAVKSVIGA